MVIDDKLIVYLEELSKLRMDDNERESAKADLGAILGYMEKLAELDTKGVEGISHPFAFKNYFRDDIAEESSEREDILKNAPQQMDGYFVVPKTVD